MDDNQLPPRGASAVPQPTKAHARPIRIRAIFVVTGWMSLVAIIPLLSPSVAEAGCLEWNLNGYWEFRLESGAWIGFNLTQARAKPNPSQFELNGKATYNMPRRANGYGGLTTRLVQGSLDGSKFGLYYSVDEPGFEEHPVYFQGVIGPDGNLHGTGPTDLNQPKGEINWREKAGRKAKCQKTSAEAEVEENPQGGAGEVLKQTTPPSAEEKTGVFEPHRGIGGILKETQP